MSKPPPAFTRLPGRMPSLRFGASAAPVSSLWLGENDLLQVESSLMREKYQWFAYRDIHALQLRRTARGVVYNVLLLLLALAPAVFIPSVSSDGQIALGILASLPALGLIINLARGPTCRCHLQTALGSKPLPSLSRVRPARRAFERIYQRVEAAQGTLQPGETAERMARLLAGRMTPRGF